MNTPDTATHPIVFYDGECGLCDRSVRWILTRDHDQVFRFAPLGGETYAALDAPDKPTENSTIVVVVNGELFTRSDAVIQILRRLGGVYALISTLGRWCPRFIRNWIYRVVAKHRLRFFGGAEACRLPEQHELQVLLP